MGTRFCTFFTDIDSGFGNAAVNQTMPVAGTLSQFRVHLTVAPGSTDTYVLTVYKNSVATALTCTVTGASSTCSDTTNSVTFAAGDDIAVGMTETGSPSASRAMYTAKFVTP